MSWSIQQVARMSGVTARALRHYEEIRLLQPAGAGANGYRYYGWTQLLRLQRILVLRELGMGLAEVASVVNGEADRCRRCANTIASYWPSGNVWTA